MYLSESHALYGPDRRRAKHSRPKLPNFKMGARHFSINICLLHALNTLDYHPVYFVLTMNDLMIK